MKIAVSATGPTLDSPVDPAFGRCTYFVVVDADGSSATAVRNSGTEMNSGAGPRAVQGLVDAGVSVVLTGQCGPQATRALSAAGITADLGHHGTVAEAVAAFTGRNPQQ